MTFSWQWVHYSELNVNDLHELLAIRQAVFVVEQESIYLDADRFDKHAYHLIVRDASSSSISANSAENNKTILPIVAYARLIPPNVKTQEVILGRILVAKDYRGAGLGKELVKRCLDKCTSLFSLNNIRLSAQIHLVDFYATLGFEVIGNCYDDGGIEHIDMLFERKTE
jgi:ElaA protein